jgi:putative ABC transport system permease protein
MRLWHILRRRAGSLLLRDRRQADFRQDLRLPIDRETERLQAGGMPPEDARRRALRAFSGVGEVKETCRDARGTATLDALVRDARHSVRRLVRDWRFTSAAVLILGLGIGANTAMFSLINATLFRGHSLVDPDRLVDIYQNAVNPGGVDANSYPAYEDMAAYTDVFASTTAVSVPLSLNYLDEGALRPAVVEHTTASYTSVLGLRPSLGRWFTPAEDTRGAAVVAVVGYKSWIRKFHADPAIIGRTIRIEGVPVTIVGVGPRGHNGTINIGLVTDFWLPISSLPALGAPPHILERRPDEAGFFVKARLRDGVTVAQAQAAMTILGRRLASEYPTEDPGRGISVFASKDVRIHPQMDALLAPLASVLLGLVGLVLAIACSNLATLLLVRGTARAKEVSVRLALGATRGQLVRHLLMESVLLSLAGGIAGGVLTWWAIQALGALDLPIALDITLDSRVLGFALVLSLGTGVAFGLAPALKSTRIDLVPTLRDDGEARSSENRWLTLKNLLVVVQVAVSVLLLGVTSLFLQMRSVSRTDRVGFAIDGIAMIETDARYARGDARTDANGPLEEFRDRVAAIPGVQSAVLTRGLPMQVTGMPIVVEGADAGAGPGAAGRPAVAGGIWAGPGFFDMLRIPILYGRAIDDRDRADTPRVAVISESMARHRFSADPGPGVASVLGRRFRLDRDVHDWIEVVGVARDTGTADLPGDLVDPTPQVFYRSFTQWDAPPTTVLARTSLDAAGLVGGMQRELGAVNGALPAISATTMAQYLEDSLFGIGVAAKSLGGLGALGLGLAGIGLYAVVAFAVSRRSREIGIRMALGARSRQVVWTVAREVAVLVGIGTGVGLTLSLMAILALRLVVVSTPGLALYRPTADPVALLSIAAFMAMVGLAAAYVPARRAATMDPLAALRRD